MIIGLTSPHTDDDKLGLYALWLRSGGNDIDVMLLSHVLGNARLLDRCDALVLSGGGDMHPGFFGRQDLLPLCKDVSEGRDRFELSLLDQAGVLRLPVLGICRGAQVLNVAFGGTLIPDIEKAGFTGHRTGDAVQRLHAVRIVEGSVAHACIGVTEGNVNTFHHQAVDCPGGGLRVSALSHDGVAEAVEWEDPSGKPFLLGVQWHPEKMKDVRGPWAGGLLRSFINTIRRTSTTTAYYLQSKHH